MKYFFAVVLILEGFFLVRIKIFFLKMSFRISCLVRSPFLKNTLYFLEQFRVYSRIKQEMQGLPIHHLPTRPASLMSVFPIRGVHFLQLTNLDGHTIVSQHPQFILGFALGVVHSIDLNKFGN